MAKRMILLIMTTCFVACASNLKDMRGEIERLTNEIRRLSARLETAEVRNRRLEEQLKNRGQNIGSGSQTRHQSHSEGRRSTVLAKSTDQPPDVLKIWVYIYEGEIYDHRFQPMSYPGRIRKVSHHKTGDRYWVLLASTFNPDVRWRFQVPRRDGKHFIEAQRVK